MRLGAHRRHVGLGARRQLQNDVALRQAGNLLRLAHHLRQAVGQLGHQIQNTIPAFAEIVPTAVSEHGRQQTDQQERGTRNARLLLGRGEGQITFDLGPVALLPVALNDAIGIKPQEIGVGANETRGVGRTRQAVEVPFLDSVEIEIADPRDL